MQHEAKAVVNSSSNKIGADQPQRMHTACSCHASSEFRYYNILFTLPSHGGRIAMTITKHMNRLIDVRLSILASFNFPCLLQFSLPCLICFTSETFSKAFGTWVVSADWWVLFGGVVGLRQGSVARSVLGAFQATALEVDVLRDAHCVSGN